MGGIKLFLGDWNWGDLIGWGGLWLGEDVPSIGQLGPGLGCSHGIYNISLVDSNYIDAVFPIPTNRRQRLSRNPQTETMACLILQDYTLMFAPCSSKRHSSDVLSPIAMYLPT